MKTGIEFITSERERQKIEEGYNTEHDWREHSVGELANAASCYAMTPEIRPHELPPCHFPWIDGWNPTPENRVRELSIAGALIAAEIDRIIYETEFEKSI